MRKTAHILNVIKAQKLPKYVIFFDTETKETPTSDTQKLLTLRLGHAILSRRTEAGDFRTTDACDFTEPGVFQRWLSSVCTGRERYYIVAHNIGFDIRIVDLLKYLAKEKWKRTSLIVQGINFLATFRKGETTIQLMNNQQLFNTSLKNLGESIGEYKSQVDFRTATDEELMVYCKQDVEVMRKAWVAWIKFITTNDLGPFRMTAASQAMATFRYRFMHDDIFIHNDDRAIELERLSYHGGRVECFFIGKWKGGDVYNVDINAMYPYIMKEHDFPTKLRRYYRSISMEEFRRVRKAAGYVAEVTLRMRDAVVPCVRDGRLVFATGVIRTALAKCELEYALQHGDLLEVHRCAVYDERPIFKEFIDFFYTKRLTFRDAGNDAFAYISKLMLNSLYGKFGQKCSVWKVIGKASKLDDGYYKAKSVVTGKIEQIRIIDGIVEKSIGEEEGFNSFVAVASYVTAASRVYLSTLIEKAGAGNVLYCDTDSLFLTAEGYNNLAAVMHERELGKLKLVGVSSDVEIYGPKWYRFGESTKSKGIRKDAVEISERVFEQDRFQSFNGALRANNLHGVIIDTVHKKLATEYRKGIVLPSGVVVPFEGEPSALTPTLEE